jgi:Putative prokaryotic signal transducing protein
MKDGDLVLLRNFPDEVQAQLAKGILESERIPVAIRRRHNAATSPYGEMFGGVDLLVRAEDREAAVLVLEAMDM